LNNLSAGKYCILYEEVDEREVELLKFPQTSGEVEEFRFPRVGTANAKSSLKLVLFSLTPNDDVAEVRQLEMSATLETHFPWLEYLVRVGWTPDGEQ
jgi:dipeptidyl-peptidase 9